MPASARGWTRAPPLYWERTSPSICTCSTTVLAMKWLYYSPRPLWIFLTLRVSTSLIIILPIRGWARCWRAWCTWPIWSISILVITPLALWLLPVWVCISRRRAVRCSAWCCAEPTWMTVSECYKYLFVWHRFTLGFSWYSVPTLICAAFISLYLLVRLQLLSCKVLYRTVSLTPLTHTLNTLHTLPSFTYTPGECERFVTSLKTNRCLLELDLSENLIGTAEVRMCIFSWVLSWMEFRHSCEWGHIFFVFSPLCLCWCTPVSYTLSASVHISQPCVYPPLTPLTHSTQNLNTVMPDLVTGGEALANLLRSEGCVLKSLKLGEC